MSIWDKYQIESKVLNILNIQSHNPDHHFGRPFLTPYQIAIEFKRIYPSEFAAIGKPIGGKNTGQHDSLSQYIARELSCRIQTKKIQNIEGRFLHHLYLHSLQWNNDEQPIEASSMQNYDLSMYRRTD